MTELIYLACPYTHDHDYIQHRRYEQVTQIASQLMQEGKYVYSPITSMHYLSRHCPEMEGSFWLEHDLVILARCDRLVVLQLNGWEYSIGLRREITFAEENNIPVEYMESPFGKNN